MTNIVNYKRISNICDLFEHQLIKNPNHKFLFSVKKINGKEKHIKNFQRIFQK